MRGSISRFNSLESHFIVWSIDNIGLPYYKCLKVHNKNFLNPKKMIPLGCTFEATCLFKKKSGE
jgi:hypothetical protein